MVECVCPVLYLQCRVPITGFSESRVIWLWISKPAGWMHHLFRTTISSFPECRIPPHPKEGQISSFAASVTFQQDLLDFLHLRQWCRQGQIRQLLDSSHHQIHCSVCLRFDTENWKNNKIKLYNKMHDIHVALISMTKWSKVLRFRITICSSWWQLKLSNWLWLNQWNNS